MLKTVAPDSRFFYPRHLSLRGRPAAGCCSRLRDAESRSKASYLTLWSNRRATCRRTRDDAPVDSIPRYSAPPVGALCRRRGTAIWSRSSRAVGPVWLRSTALLVYDVTIETSMLLPSGNLAGGVGSTRRHFFGSGWPAIDGITSACKKMHMAFFSVPAYYPLGIYNVKDGVPMLLGPHRWLLVTVKPIYFHAT